MSKLDIVDFYRFPGAVLVMVAHFIVVYYPLDQTTRDRILADLQPMMGLFFTLSGFVIMHVYDGRITSWAKYRDYVQKRLARMYPLFVMTFAAAYLWGRLTPGHREMFPNSAILPNLLLIHAWNTTGEMTFDYPSWSISAEFFVYLLFPVFLLAVDRVRRLSPVLPLITALGVAWVFFRFGLGNWMDATFNAGCLRAVPSFVAGMIVHRLLCGPLAALRVPAWLAHGVGIAAVPLMLAGVPEGVMLIYMVVLILVLVAAEPDSGGVLSQPWARMLANASFGIYLLHALVAPVLLGAAPRWLGLPRTSVYALTPVAVIVTTGLALASFRYFEDPARRWLGPLRGSVLMRAIMVPRRATAPLIAVSEPGPDGQVPVISSQ